MSCRTTLSGLTYMYMETLHNKAVKEGVIELDGNNIILKYFPNRCIPPLKCPLKVIQLLLNVIMVNKTGEFCNYRMSKKYRFIE